MNRRHLLKLSAAVAAAQSVSTGYAQTPSGSWPNRPLRLVVPTGPGSSLDLIARALADKMKERLGQPIVVDNKAGAGGLLGTDQVAKATDGHTFGISFNGPLAYAPYLYAKMPYRLPEDLAPIALTSSQPNVLAINAALPVKDVKELISWMKKNPGKANYGSVGNGSSSHLSMELLKFLTNTFTVHIPFNGSPPSAMALANGDVQMLMTVLPAVQPHMQTGKVKVIGVTSRQRYPGLPDAPTLSESDVAELKDFEAIAWNGIVGPASTPAEVIAKLNSEINLALKDSATAQRLITGGMTPITGTPQDLAKLMADENKKWGPIIKRTGATLG
jgi:tripartite-type tricarboxylate transporter receptor subunit TctC